MLHAPFHLSFPQRVVCHQFDSKHLVFGVAPGTDAAVFIFLAFLVRGLLLRTAVGEIVGIQVNVELTHGSCIIGVDLMGGPDGKIC